MHHTRNRLVAAALAAVTVAVLLAAAAPAEAQTFVYSAKFVCGFNRSNVGFDDHGNQVGEATVKTGNYATEINIVNFDPSFIPANISKRIIVLYDAFQFPPAVGREPKVVGPIGGEAIVLPGFNATMDDCIKLYQLAGLPVVNPAPLLIGYLMIVSDRPLDVTAVYTAEICTDVGQVGPDFMCYNPNSGGGISIDVERVFERRLP